MKKNNNLSFYSLLIHLAVPIAIQNLLISLLNMADTLMVGSLGEESVACVGIANQFYFVYNLIAFGICAGGSVFIAQFWGNNDKENIKKVVGLELASIFIIGGLFTILALFAPGLIINIFSKEASVIASGSEYLIIVCFSYILTGITMLFSTALRSMEEAKTPMLVSALAVLINVILNYILIFGKLGFTPLGVSGAAYATLIARIVEFLLISYLTLYKHSPIKGKIKDFFNFDYSFAKDILSKTFPVILNESCWGLGFVLYNVAYGAIGTYAIAASQISTNVQNLFTAFCFSVAGAALVMAGNRIGAGEEEKAIDYANKFFKISLILGIIMGIGVLLSIDFIISFFNVSAITRQTTKTMLIIFALVSPIRMINIICIVGIFRGGGDVKYALYAELCSMWLIGVPIAFISAVVLKLDVTLVVLLITTEEIVKAIICFIRYRSKKWVHNLTNEIK